MRNRRLITYYIILLFGILSVTEKISGQNTITGEKASPGSLMSTEQLKLFLPRDYISNLLPEQLVSIIPEDLSFSAFSDQPLYCYEGTDYNWAITKSIRKELNIADRSINLYISEWDSANMNFMPAEKYMFVFTDSGQITDENLRVWDSTNWTDIYQTRYYYNNLMELDSSIKQLWSVEQKEWVNNRRVIASYLDKDSVEQVKYVWNTDPAEWTYTTRINIKQVDSLGIRTTINYTRDTENNLWKNKSYTIDSLNDRNDIKLKITWIWDQEQEFWGNYEKVYWAYDHQHHISGKTINYWDPNDSTWYTDNSTKHIYDERTGLVQSNKFYLDFVLDELSLSEKVTYIYEDNFLFEITETRYNTSGESWKNVYRLSRLFEPFNSTSITPSPDNKKPFIFPNPVADYLYISLPENTGPVYDLGIFSITGQIIFTKPQYYPGQSIELRGINSGFYILKFRTGNEFHTLPFIKK